MSGTRSHTAGSDSRRVQFREWRRGRPFAGGVLLLLAGVLIAYVPTQFAFELALVGGGSTFVGMLWAVAVSLTGAFVIYRPDLSTILGVVGVALSILSLLGALGGFLVGMLLGIVGGNLCIAWRPERGGDGGGPGGGTGDEDPGDPGDGTGGGAPGGDDLAPAARPTGDERSGSGDRTGATADDGSLSTGAPVAARSRLRVSVAARRVEHWLADQPPLAGRRWAAPDSSSRTAASPTGPITETGTRAGPSKRLVVAVVLMVATSATAAVVGTVPVAAILGDDDRSTDTVDVGEIRLGENGRICATSVDAETYRVAITDARLVDVAVYRQRGGDVVRADLPSVAVDETVVLYTTGANDGIRRLAATAGCTDADQTSRTVFRTRQQTGTGLHASEGVTMLNLRSVDGGVPSPGGFRFAAPTDPGGGGDGEPPGIDDPAGAVEDDVDGLQPAGANGSRLANRTEDGATVVPTVTDESDRVNSTVGDSGVGNTTGAAPPVTDVVSKATGNVETETDAVTTASTETDTTATGDDARVSGEGDTAGSGAVTAAGSNAGTSAAGGADSDLPVSLVALGRFRSVVVG